MSDEERLTELFWFLNIHLNRELIDDMCEGCTNCDGWRECEALNFLKSVTELWEFRRNKIDPTLKDLI